MWETLFHVQQRFFHTINFDVFLSFQDVAIVGGLAVIFWILKDLTYQTMLSMQCEKFYLAIITVQDTCEITLLTNCSGMFLPSQTLFCALVLLSFFISIHLN